MHGGVIRAHSEGLGHGATFTVDLPIPVNALSTHISTVPADLAHALQGLNVLLVEDEEHTRIALRNLLETAGAIVQAAASVEEALHIFRKSPPNVLISDIAMPEQDGYSLLRSIRALESAAPDSPQLAHAGDQPRISVHRPAIALTARARAEDRAQSMAAGFQAHLAKPVEPAELITTVASLCRRPATT
jgi:CheY-like chemotaxis protein